MWWDSRHLDLPYNVARLVGCCAAGIVIGSATICLADDIPVNHSRLRDKGFAFHLKHFQVVQGTEAAAKQYYKEVVVRQMQFDSEATIESSTVKNLLAYFGYSNVT